MYLLATCTSRFEKHQLSSSTHFQSNLFHIQFLIHSGYQLLSDTQFSNTFSFLENFLFLKLVSFLCSASDVIPLVNVCICSVLLECNKKKCPPISVSCRISLYFLISGLRFQVLIEWGERGIRSDSSTFGHLVLTAPITDFPFPSTHC